MPLAVKLLALGLGLLGAVYALKLLRDQRADSQAERLKVEAEHAAPSLGVQPVSSGTVK